MPENYYVYIFTPYLIIDNEMEDALCLAAKRGIVVRSVTPGFIHAKSYVSNDEIGVVGTINMNFRSLYLHFECRVLMYKSGSIIDLKRDSIDAINKSRQVSEDDMKKGLSGKFFDAMLRLRAPLT